MKKNSFLLVSTLAVGAFALSSCDTPTGQGAGFGAATGAIIGAAATGNVRGAAAGAAIGAASGALIGAAVEADERGYYEGHPMGYYPYGRRVGRPGLLESPYPPHALVDVRGIPHGALVRDPESGRIFRRP
ncbi:MAG TPA: glycine zipper domain-containing protein [Chthoniobacterales bacterium]|jgi:predicted small secreted protein